MVAKLEGSAFVLTFETEETIGYRSGLRGDVLRAFYINLERRTVEYELAEEKLPIRRRVEHFPTMASLVENLPVTTTSFDLKFQGLKRKDDGGVFARPGNRIRLAEVKDPWELTNYYEKPHTGEPQGPTRLKLADEES
jgi:hypothetical protein